MLFSVVPFFRNKFNFVSFILTILETILISQMSISYITHVLLLFIYIYICVCFEYIFSISSCHIYELLDDSLQSHFKLYFTFCVTFFPRL